MARSIIKHGWNLFTSRKLEPQEVGGGFMGGYGSSAPRNRARISLERSFVASIYTRMAMDAASVEFRHVRLDDQDRYLEDIASGLNYCLTVGANIDQAASQFRRDWFYSLFENGYIALVPINTSVNPYLSSFDINDMRIGIIKEWMPQQIRVEAYDERDGQRKDMIMDKKLCAIVENPFYSVMNEANSTLQRLLRKLSLLDQVDESLASGKLDLIIQLPYQVRSDSKRTLADQRRQDLESQMKDSTYGIAWMDATEKITQLNRPAENNLLAQVEYLVALLYTQMGLTPEVMNGTADEATMLNYRKRTIQPLLTAFREEMKRKFLTKTAITQKQSIEFFIDSFEIAPIQMIAEIADVFSRNEIATPNEIRQIIGWKPAKDPNADKLQNSNMPNADPAAVAPGEPTGDDTTALLDEMDKVLDDAFANLGVEE